MKSGGCLRGRRRVPCWRYSADRGRAAGSCARPPCVKRSRASRIEHDLHAVEDRARAGADGETSDIDRATDGEQRRRLRALERDGDLAVADLDQAVGQVRVEPGESGSDRRRCPSRRRKAPTRPGRGRARGASRPRAPWPITDGSASPKASRRGSEVAGSIRRLKRAASGWTVSETGPVPVAGANGVWAFISCTSGSELQAGAVRGRRRPCR